MCVCLFVLGYDKSRFTPEAGSFRNGLAVSLVLPIQTPNGLFCEFRSVLDERLKYRRGRKKVDQILKCTHLTPELSFAQALDV